MSARPRPDPFAGWPPIIRTSTVGRAILVRDVILTLLMWVLLLLILYSELRFAWESLMVLLGRSEAHIDAELALFWGRMQPLMWLIGGLVAMLGLATIISIIRRNRALRRPAPPPLSDTAIADLAGMDMAALEQARRTQRIVVRRVAGQGLVLEPDLPALLPSAPS